MKPKTEVKPKKIVKPRAKTRVRKSPFRGILPNGEYCSSEKEYLDAWIEQSKYLESQFPGLELVGFDPTFSFKWKNILINLPRGFVLALVDRLKTGKVAPVITPEKVPQALGKEFWESFAKFDSSEFKLVPKDPIKDHPAYGM